MSGLQKSSIEATRTVCVGRYTLELPASVSQITMGQTYKGISIDVRNSVNSDQLQAIIRQDAEQRAKTALLVPNGVPPGVAIQISDDGSDLKTLRGYVLKGETAFLLSVQVESDSATGAKVAIEDLIRRIRPRDTFEVPTDAGFCIERGFIPGKFEGAETVTLGAELPSVNSEFAFSTDSGNAGTQENLIAKMSNLPVSLASFVSGSTDTLRKDSRKVVGRAGDEYGYVVKDDNTVSLKWSALPGANRSVEPGIETWLQTKAGITQEKQAPLLAMWDAVLSSVKTR